MKFNRTSQAVAAFLFAAFMAASIQTAARAADVGQLRTRIDPHVAGVFVNGKYYGTAAMYGHRERMIALAPGSYKVELKDPRYKTLVANVKIEAGKVSTVRQYMEPLPKKPETVLGELTTDGFGNAAIYINGDYYANAAELQTPGYSLLLAPAEYNVKIVPVEGEAVREEKVKIVADETIVIYHGGGMATRK
jgi:hypothetical protein